MIEEAATPYRGSAPGGHANGRPISIWQRATYRWTAVAVVMGALLILYSQHPYYRNQQFTPFKTIYPPAFVLWLALGLFYVKATLEKFHERRYLMRDGALHLLLLAHVGVKDVLSKFEWWLVTFLGSVAGLLGVARIALKSDAPYPLRLVHGNGVGATIYLCGLVAAVMIARCLQPRRIARAVKNRRIRTTLLAIIVKGFFTPLMIGFFVGHLNSISRAWTTHKHLASTDFIIPNGSSFFASLHLWWEHVGVRLGDFVPAGSDLADLVQPWSWTQPGFSWGLGFAYDIIFAIDCGWALFGYASESRWLGNKTRSVEPTAFGWMVCLACYPPFNNVLGTYLPLDNGPAIFESEKLSLLLRATVVVLFAIYAAATVSFGFKFSNLTNRGIVTRGPYRYVRHPAYLCKCSAWWLEHLPTMTLVKAFFLTFLCGVYALRAWTEERHLGMDPEYREYKKKTPWILFPGIY